MDKIGFFQESPGNNSITRVVFFIGIIWSLVFTTVVTIMTKMSVGDIVALLAGTSGPFLAMKLIQKPFEDPKNDQSTH